MVIIVQRIKISKEKEYKSDKNLIEKRKERKERCINYKFKFFRWIKIKKKRYLKDLKISKITKKYLL